MDDHSPASSLKEKASNAVIGTVCGLLLAVGGWTSSKVSDHVGDISELKTRLANVERQFDRIESKLDKALKEKP